MSYLQAPECILLVGNYAPDRQRSMQRFSAMLADALRCRGLLVESLRPEVRFGKISIGRGLGKWFGYLDKFLVFPSSLRRRVAAIRARGIRPVVHVCDHSNARYLRHLQDVPHVITCHDLLSVRAASGEFRGVKTRWTGKLLQSDILRNLSLAQSVVCDSLATLADVRRLTRLPKERVTCQYLSLDQEVWKPGEIDATEPRKHSGYLLHVGSDAWYKNRAGVVEIYRALCQRLEHPPNLVFVGPPPIGDLRSALIDSPELATSIRFVDGLDDHALARLYRGADALLIPSLAEGFGWPVLEAQACGCPVIASDQGSLPEVGGDAAVYVPSDNAQRAAEVVASVLRMETAARRTLVDRGLKNARRFSLEQMVDGYMSAYRQALMAA